MEQADTVLNISEIRNPNKGAEGNPNQPYPTDNPQKNTPLPFDKSSPMVSTPGTDPDSGSPYARMAADALGQELRHQASIWKMYVEEATEQDAELVDVQNNNLDLMLLFAGLFSAILTAFLIESTNMLQLNPADESAALLLFIAQSQRRMELGIPADANTLNPIESGKFSPTLISRFINGLWFAALALSLSAALIAMLAKEWLASYLATSVRPAYKRSLARQKQFDGLVAWHTIPIISFLPTLLHISLLLFSLGLVAYLWELDAGIATFVAIITGLTMAFYIATLFCGVFLDPCPFATQLSKYFRAALSFYITGWNPRNVEIISEGLIAHGSISQAESSALSWLAKNSHDPAVADCTYEAVAGHIAINSGEERFTRSKGDTVEAGAQPGPTTVININPGSPESDNVLFFIFICTRLSELIRQGPTARKIFHGPSLARYASVLPKLLQHIRDDIGIIAADSYLTTNNIHSGSITDYALAILEDINSIFSHKWGPLSADENALLSAAHLSLSEVLAPLFAAGAPTLHPPSQNPIGPHGAGHSSEAATGEHLLLIAPHSYHIASKSLVLSCGLALARASIQLRYHLNHRARISEAYLISLLKAISTVLAQEQLRNEAKCSVHVMGATTESYLSPGNDESQLSRNTLIVTILKLIVEGKATQINEFFSTASQVLTYAASPYLSKRPESLTEKYWLLLCNQSPKDTQHPPTFTESMGRAKDWMVHQILAISALSFNKYDWLPVTALRTLNQLLNNATTWSPAGIQVDRRQLIEHWIGETYALLFNQTTEEHEALAKVAQVNLVGSIGQLILQEARLQDSSSCSWDCIPWEKCLVPLLTIISLTPDQPREVHAILDHLTIRGNLAFTSMISLLESSKGFATLWAIRYHARYTTEVATSINTLLGTPEFRVSEENVNGLLEEVSFMVNNKTLQIPKAALIDHVLGHLKDALQRQIHLPQDHYALLEIQKFLEQSQGEKAKELLEIIKLVRGMNAN